MFGFIPFPRVLVLCEIQPVSSKIWTRVAVSISYDDNHYTTGTSLYIYIYIYICVCIYISRSASINLRLFISIYLHIYLSIYLSTHVHWYVCMYVCMYVCIYLSIYLSIYLPLFLPIYLSIYVCNVSVFWLSMFENQITHSQVVEGSIQLVHSEMACSQFSIRWRVLGFGHFVSPESYSVDHFIIQYSRHYLRGSLEPGVILNSVFVYVCVCVIPSYTDVYGCVRTLAG